MTTKFDQLDETLTELEQALAAPEDFSTPAVFLTEVARLGKEVGELTANLTQEDFAESYEEEEEGAMA